MQIADQNTDREIWRKVPGDLSSPSIHVTEWEGSGVIGINVGGHVFVAPVEEWHRAMRVALRPLPWWKYWLFILTREKEI